MMLVEVDRPQSMKQTSMGRKELKEREIPIQTKHQLPEATMMMKDLIVW